MAAIDKIYVDSYEKYLEFKEWCEKQPLFTDKYGVKESMTRYLITGWKKDNWVCHPIASFPEYIDAYIIRNCPFDYIQKELMLRYGYRNQEDVNEAYDVVMKRGGGKGKDGEYYAWMTKDDFKIEDGVITYLYNKHSDYMRIKRGEILTSPFTNYKYEIGKHFKCIKHPKYYFNRPYKCKNWWIQVDSPDDLMPMNYHQEHNSWDFMDEYVISEWHENTAFVGTIKALKRLIIKWKLPVGTIVRATGRYMCDTYEFRVTK